MGIRIIIGITGSIAAFKSLDLTRRLVKAGEQVDVVLTEAGSRFIPELNFKSFTTGTVVCDFWKPENEQPVHIRLAKNAAVLAIVPGSADFIAKASAGIADNLLLSIFLAFPGRKLIAPAMNSNMYNNPITQRNIKILKELGVIFAEPVSGQMADYSYGKGHLAEVSDIMDYILKYKDEKLPLEGKKVLISAGGTREPIDPVRFLGNRSTGRMGLELARTMWLAGAHVTLVSANISLEIPGYLRHIKVTDAMNMLKEVKKEFKKTDIFISTAAVADFRPEQISVNKLKKTTGISEIKLVRNPDILKEIQKVKKHQLIIGFAAETGNLEEASQAKLKGKNLDIIIGNLVGNEKGFGESAAEGVILGENINLEFSGLQKRQLSQKILEVLLQVMH